MNVLFQVIIWAIVGLGISWLIGILIYRLPKRISILNDARCDFCGVKLNIYEQIPILGYLINKGRCPSCFNKIPIHYLIIEIITPVLFILLYLKSGYSIDFFMYLVFIILSLIILFTDLLYYLVADIISLPGIIIGLAFSFFSSLGIINSIKGLLLGGGVFFLVSFGYKKFFKEEGMGGGDIKTMGMIGSFLGFKLTFLTIILSSIIGLITFIFVKLKNQTIIPYAAFIIIASYISMFMGRRIINFYINLW